MLEVYEVAPSLFMVDVRKAAGDTLEYHKARIFIIILLFKISVTSFIVFIYLIWCVWQFYKDFCGKLDHIIWKPKEGLPNSSLYRSMTC